jgi:hypothetical protein
MHHILLSVDSTKGESCTVMNRVVVVPPTQSHSLPKITKIQKIRKGIKMNDSTRIFEFIMRAHDCLRHGSMENRTAGFLPDCTIILCRQAELLIAARAFVVDGIIRTWWFEPALSTVCFAIFIHWYGRHEQHHNGVVVRRTTSSPTSSWTQNPIVQATVAYWIGNLFVDPNHSTGCRLYTRWHSNPLERWSLPNNGSSLGDCLLRCHFLSCPLGHA